MIRLISDHLYDADDSIESLVMVCRKNCSPELRRRLIEQFLPLIHHIAGRLHARLPRKVDRDDLVQAGFFGLSEALDSFQIEHGVSFKNYCSIRIRGAMLDDLRRTDWVPRHTRHRIAKLENLRQKLRMQDGFEPSPQHLAETFGVDPDTLSRLQRESLRSRLVSLNPSHPSGSPAGHFREAQGIADPETSETLLRLERTDWLRQGWNRLSPTARKILELYYFQDQTMREIGRTLQLCESRISQIHAAALLQMRKYCLQSA